MIRRRQWFTLGTDQEFASRLIRSVHGECVQLSRHQWCLTLSSVSDLRHAFLLAEEYQVVIEHIDYYTHNDRASETPTLWLDDRKLSACLSFDSVQGHITVEAGISVADLQMHLDGSDWFLPSWLLAHSSAYPLSLLLANYRPKAAGFGIQSGLWRLSALTAEATQTFWGPFGSQSTNGLGHAERALVTKLFEYSHLLSSYKLADYQAWYHRYRVDSFMTPADYSRGWEPNTSHIFLGSQFSLVWPVSITLALSRVAPKNLGALSCTISPDVSTLDLQVKQLFDPRHLFRSLSA